MFFRLINFIDANSILYNRQHDFRSMHSTQHSILDILHSIQSIMDSGMYTCGIVIYLRLLTLSITICYRPNLDITGSEE